MKKGLLKGLLTVLVMGLFNSAQAVTLVAGQSYQLTGPNLYVASTAAGFTGSYSITPPGSFSYFTLNFDNTISVVLNMRQSDGDLGTLRIDRLVLSTYTSSIQHMNAPAGVTTFAGGYKDIGNFFPVTNPAAISNVAIGMPGQLNASANTFKLWVKYFDLAGNSISGQTDFHLNIGSNVTAQVPEPMSMSLLGMGLLGGAIKRRKRVTA